MTAPPDDLFDAGPVLPAGLDYREDFLTAAEEAALIAAIAALPLAPARYKAYTARRRVVSFGASYDFDANVLERADPIPPVLLPLRERVAAWVELPAAHFGQALVAEYAPGTPLGWHRDVPQFGVIAGVSLGSACRMRLRPWPPRPDPRVGVLTLELAPRSVYVMRGEARWRWQHSIPPTPGLRYSITLRTGRIPGGQDAPRRAPASGDRGEVGPRGLG